MSLDSLLHAEILKDYPKDCPSNGKLKEYFENIIHGREVNNKVQKIFSCFKSSKSSRDSKVAFTPTSIGFLLMRKI